MADRLAVVGAVATDLRPGALQRRLVGLALDHGSATTRSHAIAAGVGGFVAAGVWSTDVVSWALVPLVPTWLSGLDYARSAPRLLPGPGGVVA